ncbi:hypothetical protein SRIMM317S_01267 [Streptomyces rimosus subsp. rimosus]
MRRFGCTGVGPGWEPAAGPRRRAAWRGRARAGRGARPWEGHGRLARHGALIQQVFRAGAPSGPCRSGPYVPSWCHHGNHANCGLHGTEGRGGGSGAGPAGGLRHGRRIDGRRRKGRRQAQGRGGRRTRRTSRGWAGGSERASPPKRGRSSPVYGKDADSSDATLVLYTEKAKGWHRTADWPAHNGRKGWTDRPPRGRPAQPGRRLQPHRRGRRAARPGRETAVHPLGGLHPAPVLGEEDPARLRPRHRRRLQPRQRHPAPGPDPAAGAEEGRRHLAPPGPRQRHVRLRSISKAGLVTLLRTLDPRQHPVVVMGDRTHLAA